MRTTVHLAQEVGARLGFREVLLGCLPLAGLALLGAAQPRTPDAAVAELLAADRATAAVAARDGLVAGLTGAMAPDVTVPVPGRGLVQGVAAVRAELLRDSLNARATADWAPVGGGISADGLHGFTYGFITVTRADRSTVPGKYLAYWTKGADGWRIAAYRRNRRGDGAVDTAPRAPLRPAALVAPVTDPAVLEQHRASLLSAERAFARESQEVGIQAGFARFGAPEAMNLGGNAPGFTFGNEAIAALVGTGVPAGTSHVNWWPEQALVASSGDLGVTFGYITPNGPPAAGQEKPRFPFFTIWRRAAPGAPWRYVAE